MCRARYEASDGHSSVVAIHSCLTDYAIVGDVALGTAETLLGAPTPHLRWGDGGGGLHLGPLLRGVGACRIPLLDGRQQAMSCAHLDESWPKDCSI